MLAIVRSNWRAVVVAIATVAAYHGTFSGPLLFDDTASITHNPSIRQLWPFSVVFNPPSECTVAGRPFANLTFALNYAWHGTQVRGYHIVNLAIHVGCALLLMGVARRTLELANAGGSASSGSGRFESDVPRIAMAIAVLWAVHPLLTSAVTYISQRTEILMAFFYLGTVYGFTRAVRGGTKHHVWLGVSVVSCLLGITSKEGMVTAPVLVLLYDRTFVGGTFGSALRARWRYYAALALSWVLLGLLMSGLKDRAVGYGLGVSWWNYVLTECRAILIYLKLVVWPQPLVFDYGVIFVEGLAAALPYIIGVLTIVAATIAALVRWPKVGILMAAFLLILAPTSSVVPIATQPIAENRAYLPAAAITGLLVVGVHHVLRRWTWFVASLVAIAFGWLAVERNAVLVDPLTLARDTVAKRPDNPRAHTVLAETLHHQRRLNEAKVQFETALRLKPNYPEAHNNLGTTLYESGDLNGARRHFEAAIRLKPDYASAHNNLGNVLLQLGDVDGARRHGEEALRIFAEPHRLKPDLAETHNNLGNALLYQGNLPAAQAHYREAVGLNPEFAQARMNLGVTLRLTGSFDEAQSQLEAAIRVRPEFPEAYFNLGVLLQQIGRTDGAIDSFKAALRLRPVFPEAAFNFAQILIMRGDLVSAKTYLEQVVQTRPDSAEARLLLERVNAALSGPASRPK